MERHQPNPAWWQRHDRWWLSLDQLRDQGVFHWLSLLLGGEATLPLAGEAAADQAPNPAHKRWRRQLQREFANLEAALAWAHPQLTNQPAGTRRIGIHPHPRAPARWRAENPQALRELARDLAGWNEPAPHHPPLASAEASPHTPFTAHQQAVIDHHGSPAVVVAVAGAGKTTTLIARIKRQVARQEVAPHQLLLLSFSRAAVATLRERLRDDPACAAVEVATFHALAYRLRQTSARLSGQPLPSSPPPEQLVARVRDQALRDARAHHPDLASAWRRVELSAFGAYRGRCLAELAWPQSQRQHPRTLARQLQRPPEDPDHPDHPALLHDFERHRLQLGWCDHDQSLVEALIALHEQPALLSWARSRYRAAVVDEAQDLSPVQLLTFEALFAGRSELMLVGDDDQSIYAFRGAAPGSLRRYANDHQAQVLTLPDAFRCRAEPLAAAATLMQAQGQRWALQPRSVRGPGGMLTLDTADGPDAEAEQLIRRALSHRQRDPRWATQVVLVRRFAQAPAIEQAAWRHAVPVRLEGATSVTRHPNVAAAWAGVALALGASDEQPATRQRAWRRWLHHALGQTRSAAWAAAAELAPHPGAGADSWRQQHRDEATATLLERIAEHRTEPAAALLTAGHPDTRWPAAPHPALQACAERLRDAPRDTLEALRQARHDWRSAPPGNSLLITSVHRAKGLEWPVVHVPGMNIGSFPLSPEPEERRLAYVAWTRARDSLHLYQNLQTPPSPFIAQGEVIAIAALARDHAHWHASAAAATSLAALWYRREARERFGADPR